MVCEGYMGTEKGTRKCGHIWRRPKKSELEFNDNPRHYVVCRKCGIINQIPFSMIKHYDIYFPSFPDDET